MEQLFLGSNDYSETFKKRVDPMQDYSRMAETKLNEKSSMFSENVQNYFYNPTLRHLVPHEKSINQQLLGL